jgi:Endosomal/lysosomal potassium channel TMEM175
MSKPIKHISHKLIDTLSDGVFSIALTLLGLDVVGLVHKISESKDFNSTMFESWPTFLAYLLGFLVVPVSRHQSVCSGYDIDDRLEPWIDDGLGRSYAFRCGTSCRKSKYTKYEVGSLLFWNLSLWPILDKFDSALSGGHLPW